MSEPDRPTRWLHRFAVATCCAALLPIVVGAIVTTMRWGMAFSDWPSSDGHGSPNAYTDCDPTNCDTCTHGYGSTDTYANGHAEFRRPALELRDG